jgi:hypothetical protein
MVVRQLGRAGQIVRPPVRVSQTYRSHYTDRSRQLVAAWYAPEIEEFGYEF